MGTDRDRVDLGSPRPRVLSISLLVAANTLLFVAIAYFFFARADLPPFFPHGPASLKADEAKDVPMGLIMLFLATVAAYSAHYAQHHRSWLRSRRWHRKHGRT